MLLLLKFLRVLLPVAGKATAAGATGCGRETTAPPIAESRDATSSVKHLRAFLFILGGKALFLWTWYDGGRLNSIIS